MNAKGDLIVLAQTRNLGDPTFHTVQDGPPHAPRFTTTVTVGDTTAQGEGRTKKDAERAAAEAALRVLGHHDGPHGEDTSAQLAAPASATPVPIYADVLAEALSVAHERTPAHAGVDDVRALTVRLYAGLLRDLGATDA